MTVDTQQQSAKNIIRSYKGRNSYMNLPALSLNKYCLLAKCLSIHKAICLLCLSASLIFLLSLRAPLLLSNSSLYSLALFVSLSFSLTRAFHVTFEDLKPTQYRGICTQYCKLGPIEMTANVFCTIGVHKNTV